MLVNNSYLKFTSILPQQSLAKSEKSSLTFKGLSTDSFEKTKGNLSFGAFPVLEEPAVKAFFDKVTSTDTIAWTSIEPLVPFLKNRTDRRAIVESFVRLLSNDNPNIRNNAAVVLKEINDSYSINPFINVLKNDSVEHLRRVAAEALGETGDSRAVEALTVALKHDTSGYVRADAAKALGVLGDVNSVKSLVNTYDDDYFAVPEEAKKSLIAIGKPAVKPLLDIYRNNVDNYKLCEFILETLQEINNTNRM